MQNERIDYIDCCRGICAVLIVIFHIWGIFNGFVSAFTVGCFFMLSGYVSNTDNHSVAELMRKKFWGIMVPYITVNTSYYFLYKFFKSISLERICPVPVEAGMNLLGYWINVLEFPTNGGWFTASWFLWVLFWVVVLDKICRLIFKGKFLWIYEMILIVMAMVVQKVMNADLSWFAYMDLIIIGCLFYHTGYMLKRYNVLDRLYVSVTRARQEYRGGVFILLIMCYAVYCVYPVLAVDWPLRQFRNIFISLTYTAVMFGIIYFISRILCEGHRGEFFVKLGRIAMPVMLLQFLVFSMISLFEVVVRIKDISALPSLSVATYSRWDWLVYTYAACLIIMGIDKMCGKYKLYRICICGRK